MTEPTTEERQAEFAAACVALRGRAAALCNQKVWWGITPTDADLSELRGTITLIQSTIPKPKPKPEPEVRQVTYVVSRHRDWVGSKYARSGYEPGGTVHYRWWSTTDEDYLTTKQESGSLFETVWQATCPDTPEDITAIEERAERAREVHRSAHTVGKGHGTMIRALCPDADPMSDLITDLTVEQLRKALSRRGARRVVGQWAECETLLSVTPEPLARSVTAVGAAMGKHPGLTGPESVEVLNALDDAPDDLPLELVMAAVDGWLQRKSADTTPRERR